MDYKKWLGKFSSQDVTGEDLATAQEKAGNLKDKKKDFLLLIDMFKDITAGRYKASGKTLLILGAAILYVVSPVDAISDIIPVLGWTDDALVIGYVLKQLSDEIERYKKIIKGI